MKVEHEGYVLEIEEVYEDGRFCHFTTKCKESDLVLITGIWKSVTLDFLINRFKQNVDSLLATKKKKMEEKKIKDKDLAVVEQYLFSLEKVYLEMKELVEVKRLDTLALVRDVKLNNLYEFYKGMIPLGSLDSVRDFYLNKYVNRDVA